MGGLLFAEKLAILYTSEKQRLLAAREDPYSMAR
jgi:hypothetical protein